MQSLCLSKAGYVRFPEMHTCASTKAASKLDNCIMHEDIIRRLGDK